jgi:hypothetical protein
VRTYPQEPCSEHNPPAPYLSLIERMYLEFRYYFTYLKPWILDVSMGERVSVFTSSV